MPEPASAFSYAIVRVVPDIERGEFVNAGVLLFARQHDFLAARVELDHDRLRGALPGAAIRRAIDAALRAFARVADGDADAGPIAALPKSERFGWLVAPSSTVVQSSPTHTGLCTDPQQALDELFDDLVTVDPAGHLDNRRRFESVRTKTPDPRSGSRLQCMSHSTAPKRRCPRPTSRRNSKDFSANW